MKVKFLWTFLALWALSYISLFAQPTATIVSADTDSCESGRAELKILFEGEAPFGIVYVITNKETNGARYQLELNQDIFENDLENGVWTTSTLTMSDTSEITLIEVFDNTINSADWKYSPSDDGYGSTDVSGSMTMNINAMPTPNAGDFTPQCGYVAPLNATLSDPNHIMYWDDVTGGGFNNNSIPNAIFTSETADTYTLTLTEENGACKATDEIVVDLWGSPEATISGNQIICSNDGVNYQLEVNTVIKNGTSPYRYTISDGQDEQTRTNILASDLISIQATQETTWNLTEVIDQRGCAAHIDSLHGEAIVVDNKPTPNAGLDANWCNADLTKGYTLNAIIDKGSGEWLPTTGITFDDAISTNAVATADGFGTYTLSWQETNEGCSDIATVDITFINPPTLALAKGDTAICEGANAVLRTQTTSEYYPLTLNYTDDDYQEVSLGNSYTETILNPVEVGLNSYQLAKLTDNLGCSSDLSEEFSVEVDFIPKSVPGDYYPECGNEIILNANLDDEEQGTWSSLYGEFSDINSQSSTFTIDRNNQEVQETHTLSWRVENVNNANCVSTQTVDITFNKLPENVFAGDNQTLYLIDSISLNPTGWEEGMIGWWESSSQNVIMQTLPDGSGRAIEIPEGETYLTWNVSSSDDCVVSDEFVITQKLLTAPNGFSPNAISNNEFIIGGAEHLDDTQLYVFNRNGMLVYDETKYGSNGWWKGFDNNGKLLPADTYYYTFTGITKDTKELQTKKDFLVIKY
ncbi:T9SS type B sorting domain-containing protein [Carboxylicivirga linearis]|uniref:Gliding motility-associated C-terminal domain-containing protein n=1 Tax=Carboxylicivirga linearis TaxID=1628157 RepID=A0ABS5JQ56_9BACT|nr:gliding motility-associated C-terminal domain-containing protein [Carboxylicivirga linearis]MBS2097018.1 gliding motility-associated C-terminal domain-containing protein [Carboxylicivirga linearis]